MQQKVEIRVRGQIDKTWSEWLSELHIEHREQRNETILTGFVPDQAALYGLLKKTRDMGLGLISVTRIECDRKASRPGPAVEEDVCDKCQYGKTIQANKRTQKKEV